MSKEELIKRLETLDAMAAKVAEECLPHESCEVFMTPLAVMYRMRDRIRTLESVIPECLAMAEVWEDCDGDHDTGLIKRLRAIMSNDQGHL
jgi:hypothetical protein